MEAVQSGNNPWMHAMRAAEAEPALDQEIARARRELAILEMRKRLQLLEEEKMRLTVSLNELQGSAARAPPRNLNISSQSKRKGTSKSPPKRASAVNASRKGGPRSPQERTPGSNTSHKIDSGQCQHCSSMGLECIRRNGPGQVCDECVARGKTCFSRHTRWAWANKGTKSTKSGLNGNKQATRNQPKREYNRMLGVESQ